MAACLAKQREHVVEKAHAGDDLGLPLPSSDSYRSISVSAVLRWILAVRDIEITQKRSVSYGRSV